MSLRSLSLLLISMSCGSFAATEAPAPAKTPSPAAAKEAPAAPVAAKAAPTAPAAQAAQAPVSKSGLPPIEFWVNSQTDEKYFQNMIQVYKAKVDPAFDAHVRSYGFTEMPDKLAIAIKTGV